ncbi:unnamed protein product [Amoebophrya sp. A120]|nr:unnamed protein product [Amoebophrya sp. A120]|eukprot:GSA120T00020604001.1
MARYRNLLLHDMPCNRHPGIIIINICILYNKNLTCYSSRRFIVKQKDRTGSGSGLVLSSHRRIGKIEPIKSSSTKRWQKNLFLWRVVLDWFRASGAAGALLCWSSGL